VGQVGERNEFPLDVLADRNPTLSRDLRSAQVSPPHLPGDPNQGVVLPESILSNSGPSVQQGFSFVTPMEVKTEPYGGHTDGNGSETCSQTMGGISNYAAGCELLSNAASYRLGDEGALDVGNPCLRGPRRCWRPTRPASRNFPIAAERREPAILHSPAPKAKKGGTAQMLPGAEH
jgi:hypothetical protein